jgi:hypothetical protein
MFGPCKRAAALNGQIKRTWQVLLKATNARPGVPSWPFFLAKRQNKVI